MHLMKLILRPLLGLLTLAAIGSQLIIHVRMGANVVNFFSYFTNLSNLLAAGVLLAIAQPVAGAQPRAGAGLVDRVRALSTMNMAVVGIVFTLFAAQHGFGGTSAMGQLRAA